MRGFWLPRYSTVLSIGELETFIYLRRSSFHCTSPAFSFMFNHFSLLARDGVRFLPPKKKKNFTPRTKTWKRAHLTWWILQKKKGLHCLINNYRLRCCCNSLVIIALLWNLKRNRQHADEFISPCTEFSHHLYWLKSELWLTITSLQYLFFDVCVPEVQLPPLSVSHYTILSGALHWWRKLDFMPTILVILQPNEHKYLPHDYCHPWEKDYAWELQEIFHAEVLT